MKRTDRSRGSKRSEVIRNQHIISRFYLNRFADAEKHVVTYSQGRTPRRQSTKSVCSEQDYFEYTINGEATENLYENWFSGIENDAAAVYDRLHSGQGLTRPQEVAWARFVATLFLRSRKVREQIGPELARLVEGEGYASEEQIREMQYELLQQGTFVESAVLRAKIEQTLVEMRAPAFAQLAGIEQSVEMIATNILDKPRWFILEANAPDVFITSDCPVQTITWDGPQSPITLGNGFRHLTTAIALPLSPTRLFFAGTLAMSFRSATLSVNDIAAFNTTTARFGYRAVYASERNAAIQALVDEELNRITFGENAFVRTPD